MQLYTELAFKLRKTQIRNIIALEYDDGIIDSAKSSIEDVGHGSKAAEHDQPTSSVSTTAEEVFDGVAGYFLPYIVLQNSNESGLF